MPTADDPPPQPDPSPLLRRIDAVLAHLSAVDLATVRRAAYSLGGRSPDPGGLATLAACKAVERAARELEAGAGDLQS